MDALKETAPEVCRPGRKYVEVFAFGEEEDADDNWDMEEEEVGLPPVLIELEFYVYSTIESRWINKQ